MDTEFIYTTQNPTLYRSRRIAEQMLKAFDDGDLDDVYIIYTDMVSSITFEPKILQLLPLDAEHFVQSEGEITRHHEAVFSPSPEHRYGTSDPELYEGHDLWRNGRVVLQRTAGENVRNGLRHHQCKGYAAKSVAPV